MVHLPQEHHNTIINRLIQKNYEKNLLKTLNNFEYTPMKIGIFKTIQWFLNVKRNNKVFLEASKIKKFDI